MIALTFVFGVALGAVYFGGLWLTVTRVRDVERPLLVLAGSFIARAVIAVGGFAAVVLMTESRTSGVALCLAGFVLARFVLVRRFGSHPRRRSGLGSAFS